jgi:hypothetical protein
MINERKPFQDNRTPGRGLNPGLHAYWTATMVQWEVGHGSGVPSCSAKEDSHLVGEWVLFSGLLTTSHVAALV